MNLNQDYSNDSKQHYMKQLLSMLPIDQLTPLENQPRQHIDQKSLDDLAQSIRTYGILQPIIVTTENDGRMTIIAGERRWRAAKLAGLELIPCITRNFEEYSRLELALIENIQRESLSPWDEIQCMRRLLDEYDYTHEQLAARIGKSRSAVTNALRILALPHQVLENLRTGTISSVHARALCSLDNEKLQLKILSIIIKKKLSVRQTEELIKKLKTEKPHKILGDSISADLRYICDQFKGHLGTKVKISGDSNTGKIEISYYSSEDLERISDVILGADALARI